MKKLLYLFLIIFTLSATNVLANDEIFIQSDCLDLDVSILSAYDSSELTDEQKDILRNLFISAIENHETSVDISSAQIIFEAGSSIHNSVVSYFASIANDTPEYFYVDLSKQFSFSILGQVLQSMTISYAYDEETAIERTYAFKQKAQNILDGMYAKNITSDFDIALYLHDYLALNCEYDTIAATNPNTFTGHGADAALLDKKAVCQGYANAYKYLLNKAGIECIDVYSDLGHHEWSMVNIDGNWYHADVTFDDPTPDRLGNVSHELFLLTDEELADYDGSHQKKDSHSDWYTTDGGYNAVDTTYSDAQWRNTTTSVSFIDDYRYYAIYDPYNNTTNTLPKTRIVQCDKDMEVINDNYYTINEIWYLPDKSMGWWSGFFSGLCEYNKCLYYNTGNKLMKLNTTYDNPQPETVLDYTPQNSDYASGVYLFGSYISDDNIYYAEANYVVNADNQTILRGTKNSEVINYILPPLNSIEIDDSDITIDKAQNKLTGNIDINIENLTDIANIEKDSNLYFAVYENGVLKHIKKTYQKQETFNISLDYNSDNEYTYRLFLWDSKMLPYVNSIFKSIK